MDLQSCTELSDYCPGRRCYNLPLGTPNCPSQMWLEASTVLERAKPVYRPFVFRPCKVEDVGKHVGDLYRLCGPVFMMKTPWVTHLGMTLQ